MNSWCQSRAKMGKELCKFEQNIICLSRVFIQKLPSCLDTQNSWHSLAKLQKPSFWYFSQMVEEWRYLQFSWNLQNPLLWWLHFLVFVLLSFADPLKSSNRRSSNLFFIALNLSIKIIFFSSFRSLLLMESSSTLDSIDFISSS